MTPLAPSIQDLQAALGRSQQSISDAADNGETEDLKMPGEVNEEIDPETIYMAIATTDSTVVYYRLSRGIRKPADIPDE